MGHVRRSNPHPILGFWIISTMIVCCSNRLSLSANLSSVLCLIENSVDRFWFLQNKAFSSAFAVLFFLVRRVVLSMLKLSNYSTSYFRQRTFVRTEFSSAQAGCRVGWDESELIIRGQTGAFSCWVMDVESCIRNNWSWTRLPKEVKQVCCRPAALWSDLALLLKYIPLTCILPKMAEGNFAGTVGNTGYVSEHDTGKIVDHEFDLWIIYVSFLWYCDIKRSRIWYLY